MLELLFNRFTDPGRIINHQDHLNAVQEAEERIRSLNDAAESRFFLDGPGESGKMYLMEIFTWQCQVLGMKTSLKIFITDDESKGETLTRCKNIYEKCYSERPFVINCAF